MIWGSDVIFIVVNRVFAINLHWKIPANPKTPKPQNPYSIMDDSEEEELILDPI